VSALKPCEWCGAVFERRARDSTQQWVRRRFCSTACSRDWQRRRSTVPRQCSQCGRPIAKDPRDSIAQWHARRFCSAACRRAERLQHVGVTKWCQHCGAEFEPHPHESTAQWEGRRFCSRRCAGRWRALNEPSRRLVGLCADCGREATLVKGLCRVCYGRRRYADDRERHRAIRRAWRAENPDYWKQERIRAAARARTTLWLRENPEKARALWARTKHLRRAREAGSRIEPAHLDEARAMLIRDPCSYCGQSSGTLDHVVPLSRGGAHAWANLTAACHHCNSRKSDLSLLTFLLYRPQTGHCPAPDCV
jgi:5-methylcytosine-specific restriction endonuclease McrA